MGDVRRPALTVEIGWIHDADKREAVAAFLELAMESSGMSKAVELRARALHSLGFDGMDALHVAGAEAANCDVCLTTDARMIRRADQVADELRVRVANPLDWIMERLSDED